MQIQLKQTEIEAALRMFISSQGINLTGKTVEVAFTSGRKDNGLSAELTIEDAVNSIPAGPIPRTVETGVAVAAVATPETDAELAAVKPVASLFK